MIPLGTTAGSAVVGNARDIKLPTNVSLLAVTLNPETATCGGCCFQCDGYGTCSIAPSPGYCPVSANMQFNATAYNTNGQLQNINGYGTWSSTNTSVAQPQSTAGLVKGVAAGTATINFAPNVYKNIRICNCIKDCPLLAGCGAGMNVMSVSQSPSGQLNMSTGDSESITVTIQPSTLTVTPSFTGTTSATSNPNSSCAASLTAQSNSGAGNVSDNFTVPSTQAGCSGVFSVQAQADGVTSSNSTTFQIPPQVLIQMMYGEADGAGTSAQMAVGIAARNRFNSSYFPGSTNYQNTVTCGTPCQFKGIDTTITTGVSPELANAVEVWLSQVADFITPAGKNTSQCFWSPSSSEWTTINNALSSKTTSETGIPNDTGCYSGASANQQIRIVSSVGTKTGGVPNFVFQGARSFTSDPVVVQVN